MTLARLNPGVLRGAGGDAPQAGPDAITAIFGPASERATDHLALMGLTRVPTDPMM